MPVKAVNGLTSGYVICTSSTRPASPARGQMIYETDTDKVLHYTTSTTGWVPPWNLPWGIVGTASQTADTTFTTTATDITGMTVTWTAVANRKYETTLANLTVYSSVASDRVDMYIANGAGTAVSPQASVTVGIANTLYAAGLISVIETGITAVSTTRKMRALRGVGSGTCHVYYDGGYVPVITVQDLGPNGAPA